MEETLRAASGYIALCVETVAVLIVAIGAAEAFVELVRIVARPRTSHGERKALWRRFGVWLLLALEFELAADIVRSVISPTWQDIGTLGAIAVIRTFLNYFLEQDLEHHETEPALEATADMRTPLAEGAAKGRALPM
jgi:uncharacterized membrane protein